MTSRRDGPRSIPKLSKRITTGKSTQTTQWERPNKHDSKAAETDFEAAANGLTVEQQKVINYNKLIDAYTKQADPNGAARTLAEMEAKGLAPNVVSYNILIAAHAKMLQPAESAKWLQKMEKKGIRPDVVSYSSVIDHMRRHVRLSLQPNGYKKCRRIMFGRTL